MSVSCQILLNKVHDVYKPGEAVTGRIKFYVQEPTEYRDVILSFLGKGKCKWTVASRRQNYTYRGTEEHITTLVNICNKRPNETITLQGKYQYPFEFYLPENIPRSYQDTYSSIKYYIEMKFVKTNLFSFNNVFRGKVPVYSYMRPQAEGPIIFGLQKTLLAPFAPVTPVVYLRATIEKECVAPGENIHLLYLISNNTDVGITALKTELYCYTKYTANCGGTKIVSEKVHPCEAETSGVPERKEVEISCELPTFPELFSVVDSNIISKEYRVRVTIRLPIPHMNATKEFRILIGEQKYDIDPCVEAKEHYEPPPSYWEVTNEEQQ